MFETCKGGGLKGSGTFNGETASMSARGLPGVQVCIPHALLLSHQLGRRGAVFVVTRMRWFMGKYVHVCMCLANSEKLQLI